MVARYSEILEVSTNVAVLFPQDSPSPVMVQYSHGPHRYNVSRLRRRKPEVRGLGLHVGRRSPARYESVRQAGPVHRPADSSAPVGVEIQYRLPRGYLVVLQWLRTVLYRADSVRTLVGVWPIATKNRVEREERREGRKNEGGERIRRIHKIIEATAVLEKKNIYIYMYCAMLPGREKKGRALFSIWTVFVAVDSFVCLFFNKLHNCKVFFSGGEGRHVCWRYKWLVKTRNTYMNKISSRNRVAVQVSKLLIPKDGGYPGHGLFLFS